MIWKSCFAALSVGLVLTVGADVACAQQAGMPGGASAGQAPAPVERRLYDLGAPPVGFPVGLPQVPQVLPAPPATSGEYLPDSREASSPASEAAALDRERAAAEAELAGPATADGAADKGKDEPDLAKRVESLEKALKKQAEAEAKKAEAAAKKPTFKIGGRVQVDYWSFPDSSQGINHFENPVTGVDPEDRFLFRRIRLETEGDIFETMLYRMQVDFNEPAQPQIKDVYLGFKELPYNQTLTIGNQKRPLGLDALDSTRFTIFLERPLVADTFNEDYRRLGVLVSGYTDDEVYNWRYGVFNLQNIGSSGAYIGDSLQLSGNARLGSTPWYDESSGGRGYWHWAVAGMFAKPDGNVSPADSNFNEARFRTRPEMRTSNRWLDTGAIRGADWYEILGLESRLNVGPLQVTSEYMSNWLQRDNTTVGTGPDLHFQGAYVAVSYFLTGEFNPIDRRSGTQGRVQPLENFFLVDRCRGGTGHGWGGWQVAARYSHLDLTNADIRGGVENNFTYALNWYWTSHSKLQFDTTYGDIDNHAPVGGFTSGHFTGMGTRLMVDF